MILANLEEECKARLKKIFFTYLQETPTNAARLQKAMYYAMDHHGKFLRPLLIYSTGLAFDVPLEDLDVPAAAMECIHTFSLIHDDLPAMDNADYRRGKLSVHKQFSEAEAILAGDALHTLAFKILASHPSGLTPLQRMNMINNLTDSTGFDGMIGGQALDIMGVDSVDSLLNMYSLKTGKLLVSSIKLGLLAGKVDLNLQNAFLTFAKCIGLAFQIQDDLLDLHGSFEIMGKYTGQDALQKKCTYPLLAGKEKAVTFVDELFAKGIAAIESHEGAHLLISLTEKLIHRRK